MSDAPTADALHVPVEAREAALRALEGIDMNVGFARAVVEGLADGELWCDRPDEPAAFHAAHPCGMSLVWGPDVAGAFDAVVRRLRTRAAGGRAEWLQVEPRWAASGAAPLEWDAALDAVPVARCVERDGTLVDEAGCPVVTVRRTRLNFAFDAAAFAASCEGGSSGGALLSGALLGGALPGGALPDGVTVRPAGEADLMWQGGTVPGRFWTEMGSFAAAGGGAVVEADGVPAAIAFVAFRMGDDAEVGIETVPGFRRRGLARVACAALVEDLVRRGLVPVWSCREDNAGSTRLAESLGFAVSRRHPYYELRPTPHTPSTPRERCHLT